MSQPEKSFRIGRISASVFLNAGSSRGDEPREFRSVSLQRRYRTGDIWRSSGSFTLADLPAAVEVLRLALNYVESIEAPA